mgnify:CR=1 FL=1
MRMAKKYGNCWYAKVQPLRSSHQLSCFATPNIVRAIGLTLNGWPQPSKARSTKLVHRLSGRFGWELRLVVQGGLHILDKIVQLDHATLHTRP